MSPGQAQAHREVIPVAIVPDAPAGPTPSGRPDPEVIPIRHLTLTVMVVACLATVGLVSGCGSSSSTSSAASSSSSSSSSTHFAKTKFLLHSGLAFGAFHRYIYEPFKAGDLKHPFEHKLTLVKAGLAALFIEHQLRLAAADTKSSKLLTKLFSPLTAVADKIASLKDSITGGSANSSDIGGLQSQLTSISKTAAANGHSIQATAPSAGQLASGG